MLNLTTSCQQIEKVSQLFVIMLIIVPLAPTVAAQFNPSTILLHILPLSINRCFKAAVRNFFGLKIIQK